MAWRSFDSAASSNANRIFIADADGTDVVELLALDGTVSRLELSPTAEWIAVLCTGRTTTSGTELLMIDTTTAVITVLDTATNATDITLNPDACIWNGIVHYTKKNGSTHDVYRAAISMSPQRIVTTSVGDERFVTVTSGGDIVAFRRSIAGVSNVIELWGTPTPTEHAVTTHVTSGVAINSVMTFRLEVSTPTGYTIFQSTGNYAGANSDGSMEIFRHEVGTSTIQQLTSFDGTVFSPGFAIMGAALGGDGQALAYSAGFATWTGVACSDADRNSTSLWVASSPADVVIGPAAEPLVPPFRVLAVGCAPHAIVDSIVECDVSVTNSEDSSRTFVVTGAWTITAGWPLTGSSAPGPFTLAPGEMGVVTMQFMNSFASQPQGNLDVFVLSPEVPMPDSARVEMSF